MPSTVLLLSLTVVLFSAVLRRLASLTLCQFFQVLMGLEGTLLLASALTPALDELSTAAPRPIARRLWWWLSEARTFRTPVTYDPLRLYCGLLLIAGSLVLSVLSGAA
jgi:hypothetical protein